MRRVLHCAWEWLVDLVPVCWRVGHNYYFTHWKYRRITAGRNVGYFQCKRCGRWTWATVRYYQPPG